MLTMLDIDPYTILVIYLWIVPLGMIFDAGLGVPIP